MRFPWLGCAVLVVWWCGCSGKDDPPLPDAALAKALECPPLPDAGPSTDAGSLDAAPLSSAMAGTWIILARTATEASGFSVDEVIAKTAMIMVHSQDGETLTVTETLCYADIHDEKNRVQVKFLEAYFPGIEPLLRPGAIRGSAQAGFAYELPKHVFARGWTPADPAKVETEALPKEGSDKRVVDLDKDGNPGYTLIITGLTNADLWVVERDATVITGQLVTQDRVEGSIAYENEQVFLGPPENVHLPKGVPSPDKSQHRIRMVRVLEKVAVDCQWVRDNLCRLFPDYDSFGPAKP
jgi:hypothetical protein